MRAQKNKTLLQKVTSRLGLWRNKAITKHKREDDSEILHPAAAPLGTDQEAGGQVTAPDGTRKYSTKQEIPAVEK